MDLNRAQLIGNVTRDPDVRTTPTGQSVCSFGVATNAQWTDAQGSKQVRTEFHNVVAWGKLADICRQYLSKGKKIFLEGRIQSREWEAQDGQKRTRTEIIAENMIMLDRGGAGPVGSGSGSDMMGSGSAAPRMSSASTASSSGPALTQSAVNDPIDRSVSDQEIRIEDIPF
jgi:single-strand DNA-binding protein